MDEPDGETPSSQLAGQSGLQHIRVRKSIRLEGNTRLRWAVGHALLDGLLLPFGDEETLLGTAPSNPASELQSVTIRRRVDTQAAFLAVFASATTDDTFVIESVDHSVDSTGAHVITVRAKGRWDQWIIRPEPESAELTNLSAG